MKKRLFISDIHMSKNFKTNINNKNYKYDYDWLDATGLRAHLLGLLAYIAKRKDELADLGEVVLVGDVMDDWVCPADVVPPTMDDILKANKDVVDALNNIMGKGVELRYMPGNHDMSIDSDTMLKHFGHTNFHYGGNHHDFLRYEVDGIICEHGSSSGLFNAPDRTHDPVNRLPLGYFLTRLTAQAYAWNGVKASVGGAFGDYLTDILKGKKDDYNLVAYGMKALCDMAGMKTTDRIYIRPGSTFAGAKKGFVTVDDVIENYRNIFRDWDAAEPRYLLPVAGAVFADNDNLLPMIGPLGDRYPGNGIVIMGHTHYKRCITHPVGQKEYIYANCGCWGDETGKPQYAPGSFVVTEPAMNNRTRAQLYTWDGTRMKADGKTRVYNSKPTPMSQPTS